VAIYSVLSSVIALSYLVKDFWPNNLYYYYFCHGAKIMHSEILSASIPLMLQVSLQNWWGEMVHCPGWTRGKMHRGFGM